MLDPQIRRRLGFFDATMIVMGGIVGAGIFINPYLVAAQVHTPMLILGVWLVGGALALLGAFIWAELAIRLPGAGGQYLYLRDAYHPAVAFLYGWVLLLVTHTGGMAAVAITFAKYYREVTGSSGSDATIAATALLALSVVNCLGARAGSNLQSALMMLKATAIAAIVFLGISLGGGSVHSVPLLDQPVSFGLVKAIGAAMIPVAFAYGGWQTSSFVASEMRDPGRDLARGLIVGVIGVVALYVAINFVYLRVLGPVGLEASHTPASSVVRAALGHGGERWIAGGIAVSTFGFLSQGMLTAPRVYRAMAQDGLFFRSVAWLSPRSNAPIVAILLQGVVATIIVLSGRYSQIVNYVVSIDFISIGLTAASLFVLRGRARGLPWLGGFLVPGHPYSTALFVGACAAIVGCTIAEYPANALIGLIVLGTGFPVYMYWRHRARRPSSAGRIISMKQRYSGYMYWAKTQSGARFNLASSGVASFPLRDLLFTAQQLEINGESKYGYPPLQYAIARKCEVDPDCVVAAAGTSMANHLAMATLIDPGDEVLIEHPAYELLVSTALYLGAHVKRFTRSEESGYALNPAAIRRVLTPKTKLIVITNLHNPSSALTPNSVLCELGDLARSVGAHVLVDEVYLDSVYENTPASAYHLGSEFVVTSSLTKVYGLSGLRCGWILARPELARDMWRLNDLFGSISAHPVELLSVLAFEYLDQIRRWARKAVDADHALLDEFLEKRTEVSAPRTKFGTTSFLRLEKGQAQAFLTRLRADHDTSVVPGHFFEMPNHFRIGMGVNTDMFREGLRRISCALADG
jgi:APA family basic amino acid/polyamine antiporter